MFFSYKKFASKYSKFKAYWKTIQKDYAEKKQDFVPKHDKKQCAAKEKKAKESEG
jgi:hypothetical protein